MAAIDKLRCKNYYEYQDFLTWCMVNYPKALRYFRCASLSPMDWQNNVKEYIKDFKTFAKRDYERLGNFNSRMEAIDNLREYYKKTADYDAPDSQLVEEVSDCMTNIALTNKQIAEKYEYTIGTFPFKVDRYLKWRCPISFVREYLYNQCGVDKKKNWMYKIFFKD